MNFGEMARTMGRSWRAAGLALALLALPQGANAQEAAPAAAAPVEAVAAPPVEAATALEATPAAAAPVELTPEQIERSKVAPGGYTPMKPTPGVGMPVDGGIGLQTQYAPLGEYARWIHDIVLLPLIFVIAIFVLLLLVWVIVRYNRRANPVPSKTSHNTVIEVVWTLVPVLILVAIAIPSITLLARQYEPPPAKALTIKATGYQWYWGYAYPDNGGFEVISNMLSDDEAHKRGEPAHLAADYRMVVPAGETIRLQVVGADVIHAFAVPSLWFKIDAVPGRINERTFFVEKPGVYYGQCSELCGVRHGYMPIVVEALPRDKFNAWVLTQAGGKIDGMPEGAPEATPAAASAEPAEAAPANPA